MCWLGSVSAAHACPGTGRTPAAPTGCRAGPPPHGNHIQRVWRPFRSDSLPGVPGLFEVYRAGRVALANAPETGVADDKVIYAYIPKIIRYSLGEDSLLPNVPTYVCWADTDAW